MSIACVTELSAISNQSFEDAINMAVNRTTQTLRNVEGARVKGMNVMIENNNTTFGILRNRLENSWTGLDGEFLIAEAAIRALFVPRFADS